MRLWSLHPRSLDGQGLVACWRETLLAQKVLRGLTRGYRNHPQLHRFRALDRPLDGIGGYLSGLADDAERRGYRFNRALIAAPGPTAIAIEVPDGQLRYERWLLDAKLALRGSGGADPTPGDITPHPLFRVVSGGIADWEKILPGFPSA